MSATGSDPVARVVTFYSYKGGVGRTMAVANVASWLVNEAHKRVFLIDFDLEAPGLSYYARHTPLAAFLPHRGLVELLTRYRETAELPDLAEYVIREDSPRLGGGTLTMLSAGLDQGPEYAAALAQLDWSELYESGFGFEFMEYLRERILEEFEPDIVLIDSRTGLHGIGTIAVQHLPDLVVLPFNLSRQSVAGTRQVLAGIEASPYQRETGRTISTLLVASPVYDPDSEPARAGIRRAEAELGRRIELRVPFSGAAAYEERWWSLDSREAPETLLHAYAQIGQRLVTLPEPAARYGAVTRGASLEARVARLFEVEGYKVELVEDDVIDAIATRDRFPSVERVGLIARSRLKSVTSPDAILDTHPSLDRVIVVNATSTSPHGQVKRDDPRVTITSVDALVQRLLPFRAYLDRLEGDTPHVGYETLDLREDEDGPRLPSDDYLTNWLDDPEARLLTVLGDYGAGKTSLCRYLAAQLGRRRLAELERGEAWTGRVPVLISLRNYAKALEPRSLINDLLADPRAFGGGRYEAFDLLNKEGRLLIFLDGVDEMATRADERAVIDNFRVLLGLVGERSKVLLTCRTHYFETPGQVDTVMASELTRAGLDHSGPGSAVVGLAPLTAEQVAAIVNRRADEPERVLALIRKTRELSEIASQPLLLDLILRTRPGPDGAPDLDAAALYELYSDGWAQRKPNHVRALGNFAVFMQTVREDMDAAERLYTQALDADPKHGHNLGNFAFFMATVRGDMDAAERLFTQAIDADSKHARNLGNFAFFMETVRGDMDAAERLYTQALDADPKHARNLGSFALFMATVRGDMDAAEHLYTRAVDVDPKHAHSWANYAGMLFALGRANKAIQAVERALALPTLDPVMTLELRFYEYAHAPERRERAATQVEELLAQGVCSPGFDLSPNLTRAIADGHPDPERLASFVERIAAKPEPTDRS